MYTQGKLYVGPEDLILLKTTQGQINNSVISVPPALFPGLMNALHLKLDHPSRSQLINLVERYFYTPGWRSIIENISTQCHQCAALKTLPKVLIEDTTSLPQGVATNLAADIIERASQKILIIRDTFSQFIRGTIVPDQKMETLRDAILGLIIDIIPNSGTDIRVDGATSLQALAKESTTHGTILNAHKIKVTIGRLLNKNKNPVAENANKEVQKEILRYKKSKGPITPIDLQVILKNINSRIRSNGFSPMEIMFQRDMISNDHLQVDESRILDNLQATRQSSSKSSLKYREKFHKRTPHQSFTKGDLVYLRGGLMKNNPRDMYIVEDLEKKDSLTFVLIRKLQLRLNTRLYRALPEELVLAPSPTN